MADKVEGFAKKHHEKAKFCYSRPSYREARWERAVKVYTINQESKYIIVNGVSSVGVSQELSGKLSAYGYIAEYRKLDDYPTEDFTEVYLVKYEKISNARFAKRKMDNKSFFGGILHVCYAPEFESVEECRQKIEERRKMIARKTRGLSKMDGTSACSDSKSVTSTTTKPPTEQPTTAPLSSVPSASSNNYRAVETALSPNTAESNTVYHQSNRVCHFPQLPPPPCPSTFPIATPAWDFYGASSGLPHYYQNLQYNNAVRGQQTGPLHVPRYNVPWNSPQTPHQTQKRHFGPSSLFSSEGCTTDNTSRQSRFQEFHDIARAPELEPPTQEQSHPKKQRKRI